MARTNSKLKNFYDKVYLKGEKKHYSKLLLGDKITEEKKAILGEVSWSGKKVLDVGCGTGELAFLVAKEGAEKVVAIDYSASAIEVANANYHSDNLAYRCEDINKISGSFDVITVVGVLEHIDDPLKLLKKLKKMLAPKGSIIVTCPNWSNPRGYILLALKDLFDAEITLADIHYFTPVEFEKWSKLLKMFLSWKTLEHDWGHGKKLIKDFTRRLPNVLKPLKGASKTGIDTFIKWLDSHVSELEGELKHNGATGFYHFRLD
ncbi:MAG: class I SAM-dependent methyltransferase [Candidatus Paceibacterota bacterium]|jgi:ubiquinone biosynthesis O-methyltransferase